MKVAKTLGRLARSPENPTELSRVGRALAHELTQQRLDVLRDFRTKLSGVEVEESSYAAGYVASMLDIVAEYEVHLRAVDDQQAVARTALREDWREILEILSEGPRLPSDLALRVGKDRPSVTRMLKRMRTAGLVEAFAADSLDGRMRPHRLTLQGNRLLGQLQQHGTSHLSEDMMRGITLAVALCHRLATKPASTPADLGDAANALLGDESMARDAVRAFADESRRAGLISSDAALAASAPGHGAEPDVREHEPIDDNPVWQRIPAILSALDQYRDQDTAIYVRTDDSAWGAWAYALQEDEQSEGSRTIVRGDILARSLTPPDKRFSLVYDNPEAIGADMEEPAMRAFLERAHAKFVVAARGEPVPEGFIPLSTDDPGVVEQAARELAAHGSDDHD